MATQFHSQSGKFLAVIAQNMPAISGDDMQYWVENPKHLQEKLAAALVREERQKEVILRFNGAYDFPATKEYDPSAFFRTRQVLYVWDGLQKLVLPHTRKTAAPAQKLGSYDLVKCVSDSSIRAELPEGHVFPASEGLARLAAMIEAQWSGKEGPLLNNGYANLFYVQVADGVFVVDVRWRSDNRGWGVGDWRLDDARWVGGDRVFSPASA